MTEILPLLGLSLFFVIVGVAKGLRNNFIDGTLAHFSVWYALHQKKRSQQDRREILRLFRAYQAAPKLFGISAFNLWEIFETFGLFVIAILFCGLAIRFALSEPTQLMHLIISLFLDIVASLVSMIASHKGDLFIAMKILVKEEQRIANNFPPGFDETGDLLNSPQELQMLKRSIQELENKQSVRIELDDLDDNTVYVISAFGHYDKS